MKEIQLTQGKVALVDAEDFERLNCFKWYASKYSDGFYAMRCGFTVDGKRKTIYMHREIMNTPYDMDTDHINYNGLDNRKKNLRNATRSENNQNRRYAHKDNKLGIKGVRWHTQRKKFTAQIQVKKKKIHLGCFNVLGDADSAYRKAEEKYFREFARCN